MAAPKNVYAFSLTEAVAAADRWSKRAHQHEKFERAARNKQYTSLDTPERCAARANRLLGRLKRAGSRLAESMASDFDESTARQVAAARVTAQNVSDALLERVIGGTRDFQFVEFLEQATYVCRSVGRIVTKLGGGRMAYGTGFMASPRLLMTNHHVLPSRDDAARSVVEFDYQRDRLGRAVAVRSLRIDPDAFFLNDEDLDFALVAVAADGRGSPLGYYGWCPLIKELGKIVAGEPINIIQHPMGEMKQVVLRENRLIDSLDGAESYLHYEADTEPGSSGSPVFNDQWEVVALHHSGVPKRNTRGDLLDVDGKVWKDGDDPSRLEWVANEGVRASKLVEFIAKATVKPAERPLLKEFLEARPPGEADGPSTRRVEAGLRPDPRLEPEPEREDEPMPRPEVERGGDSVTFTIPLYVTVSVGAPAARGALSVEPVEPASGFKERVVPDPDDLDYRERPGYDAGFLGFEAPFPRLTNATRSKAFALPGEQGVDRYLLKYHHYSLIFNKARKLAFAAGVNYDPNAKVLHRRDVDGDKWYYDPRVTPEKEIQAGESLYAGNPLDRGHLVRRADAGWGATKQEAKLANDDTFHFTNCSPQHEITNQGKTSEAPPGLKLWGNLEDHVAAQGKKDKRKLSIFNGPVFRPSDRKYRGVLLPREFWKAVVFADDEGRPAATAFILTQAELIQDLQEEFTVGEYKAVQVRIADLEARTGLDFGPASGWDVLEQEGAEERFTGDSAAVVLESLSDVVL
ncbi:DNA/RNA non-specific endonuclease [Paludisphaera mucosa]|uniref:Serine protease n=1 Tax=Paludisphaera mucosa TaxID=3030827 RepID=A0ABT6F5G7_9BACT|nr:DNA/RNA non-specific endonuclease [Paludisphaera mucosa]MDG3002823.1 DNA/RNA non-specific endonuclease [Paludisphaera mucosa]